MFLNMACVVTLLNLSCGFFAIMLLMAGDPRPALVALLVAFVGDGLDGYLARKTNSASAFGERLDSLSDVIAFGVAPTFFALGIHPEWKLDLGAVLALIVYLVCGACRLARYDPTVQKDQFKGMPIPAAGLLLTSLAITADNMPFFLLAPLTLGLLMVSDVPFMKLKFTGPKKKLPVLCAIFFFAVFGVTHDVAVATLAFTVPYLLLNLGLALFQELRFKGQEAA